MSNVSVHRRRLVRRTVERLVGIYVLAVHALDLSEIVAARSMLFAGGWWRIHFTCGSPYILIPTSRVRGPDTLWRVPWNRLFAFYFMSICLASIMLPSVNTKTNVLTYRVVSTGTFAGTSIGWSLKVIAPNEARSICSAALNSIWNSSS